ncbi:MAG: formylglycine-generating enzyme family protein [Bacteroidetes bacterium]|nr:formylglycine-generating enzyme family protein [Bacteroidota bacterium]
MKKLTLFLLTCFFVTNITAQTKPQIEWVNIPGGIFIMGSDTGEVNRHDDEAQLQVTISAFKMSKYEITFEQYNMFCKATGKVKPDDKGWGQGKHPVINVSWDDANAFSEWMGCRLPTEAEWEYACRAGSDTPFNTGDNLTTSQANYDGNYPYNNNVKGKYLKKTLAVGSFAPNAFGLYDMHGNVWEWCSDFYSDYSLDLQTNPKGPSSGKYRVRRGGGWGDSSQACRSAFRDSGDPSGSGTGIGFRIVTNN